jgi:acyl-CoA hydrolase
MEIGVRVDAENPKTGEVFHTATAYCTFVAVDDNGRPTPVPGLVCQTPEEKRRYEEAQRRRELRLKRALVSHSTKP